MGHVEYIYPPQTEMRVLEILTSPPCNMPSAHNDKHTRTSRGGHAYSCLPTGRSLLILLEYAAWLHVCMCFFLFADATNTKSLQAVFFFFYHFVNVKLFFLHFEAKKKNIFEQTQHVFYLTVPVSNPHTSNRFFSLDRQVSSGAVKLSDTWEKEKQAIGCFGHEFNQCYQCHECIIQDLAANITYAGLLLTLVSSNGFGVRNNIWPLDSLSHMILVHWCPNPSTCSGVAARQTTGMLVLLPVCCCVAFISHGRTSCATSICPPLLHSSFASLLANFFTKRKRPFGG